jgi:hypothetical protein
MLSQNERGKPMENMGSARHRSSSSMLITPEAGLLNRCGRGWRDLSIVVWPGNKIHSFLHQELDLLDYLYIFVPWEEFLFLF